MIFLTVGSQKFQFNRLLMSLDKQIENKQITDIIFAQIGFCDYKPLNYGYKAFLNRDEYSEKMKEADIIITHAGTGAIISALKNNKKVIAVPRLSKYGEHVDNHQLEIVEQFKELNLICECRNCNEIWKAIKEVKHNEYEIYKSNTSSIINSIERFIDGINKD